MEVDWSAQGVPPVPVVHRHIERPGAVPPRLGLCLDYRRRGDPPRQPAPILPPRAPDPLPLWAPHWIELPDPRYCPSLWHFPREPLLSPAPEAWFCPWWGVGQQKRVDDPTMVALIWQEGSHVGCSGVPNVFRAVEPLTPPPHPSLLVAAPSQVLLVQHMGARRRAGAWHQRRLAVRAATAVRSLSEVFLVIQSLPTHTSQRCYDCDPTCSQPSCGVGSPF